MYLVSAEDKMITPDAQRAMPKRAGSKVVETKGNQAVCASQPEAVASLIEEAGVGSVPTGSRAAANPVIKGMSVFHCHLFNHEEKGMMARILFE